MALSAQSTMMTSQGHRGIHPFFDRAFALHNHSNNEFSVDTPANDEHRDPRPLQPQAGDILPSEQALPSPSTHFQGPVPVPDLIRKAPDLEQDQKSRGRQTYDGAAEHEDVQESLGQDPNSSRRKRRKVTPLAAHNYSWLDQLRDAAEGAPQTDSSNTQRGDSKAAQVVEEQHNETKTGVSLSREPTEVELIDVDEAEKSSRSNKGDDLPKQPDVDSIMLKTASDTADDNVAPDSPTERPRKVLRLNGKGGLGSPTAQRTRATVTEGTTTVESNSPLKGRRGRPRRSRIVTLSYGEAGEESRRLMAARIQQILSESPVEATILLTKPVTTNPSKPLKPTHPFFLGKTQPVPKAILRQTPPPADESANIQEERSTPTLKSFSTPGKLRHQASQYHVKAVSRNDERSIASSSTQVRFTGTNEPPWPTNGLVRIQPFSRGLEGNVNDIVPRIVCRNRKRKSKTVLVDPREDSLLREARKLASTLSNDGIASRFRRPTRSLVSGNDLVKHVQNEVFNLCDLSARSDMAASCFRDVSKRRDESLMLHPAISKLLAQIETTLSAFDKGECESRAWTQKYSPQTAGEVLQTGKEVQILKAWLQGLTVAAVESSAVSYKSAVEGKDGLAKRKKKRRKNVDDLDDFIVSSDDGAGEMQDISDDDEAYRPSLQPHIRSTVRTDGFKSENSSAKRLNVVLLAGPHGSGKSAAAYAVAKELGFDVFEINSGSRRSGRDILEKVGDMSLNHQVGNTDVQLNNVPVATSDDVPAADEQQSTLKSFFGPKKAPPKSKRKSGANEQQLIVKTKARRAQKQSLILLEEVDVLFEEDKQFWETILDLASRSKRPIIMTCNNEALVPVEDMQLHAVLRFRHPVADLSVAYLLAMAALEGHMLDHGAIWHLFMANCQDLRASINTLNFWCQMAVGDRKGGMDWMLKRWPPGVDVDEYGRTLRVVSSHTYQTGMGMLGTTSLAGSFDFMDDADEKLFTEAWVEWRIDPAAVAQEAVRLSCARQSTQWDQGARSERYESLVQLDEAFGRFSSVDVFSKVDLPTRAACMETLDPTQPPASERALADLVSGCHSLHAETKRDWSQMDTRLSSWIYSKITSAFERGFKAGTEKQVENQNSLWTQYIKRLESSGAAAEKNRESGYRAFKEPFEPLMEFSLPPSSQAGSEIISSFDHALTVTVEDLAPYVRSIADFDLSLERRRQALENLLAQEGARRSKRPRTTRASRSALEGSQRAVTRRERWFPKGLDLEAVLKTAGDCWPRLEADKSQVVDAASIAESGSPTSSADVEVVMSSQ